VRGAVPHYPELRLLRLILWQSLPFFAQLTADQI